MGLEGVIALSGHNGVMSDDVNTVRSVLSEVEDRATGLRWAEERPWRVESHVHDARHQNTTLRQAQVYALLLDKMWNNKYITVSPLLFKNVGHCYHQFNRCLPTKFHATKAIERVAPQFSGHRQHDSQELMNYLLDGIHHPLVAALSCYWG